VGNGVPVPRVSAENYAAEIDAKYEGATEGAPEYEIAGYIAFDTDPRKNIRGASGLFVHLQVYISCTGMYIPVPPSWIGTSSLALHCPGGEWAYPTWACRTVSQKATAAKVMMDTRDLFQRLQGCCIEPFQELMG